MIFFTKPTSPSSKMLSLGCIGFVECGAGLLSGFRILSDVPASSDSFRKNGGLHMTKSMLSSLSILLIKSISILSSLETLFTFKAIIYISNLEFLYSNSNLLDILDCKLLLETFLFANSILSSSISLTIIFHCLFIEQIIRAKIQLAPHPKLP